MNYGSCMNDEQDKNVLISLYKVFFDKMALKSNYNFSKSGLYHQIQDKYEYEDIVNMIGQYSMADRHDIHVIYETKYHSVQNEDINHLFENLNKHQEVLDPD